MGRKSYNQNVLKPESPDGSALALVSADEFGLRENVAVHSFFELCLGRMILVGQHRIQRVKFVEITMTADRRTRTAITGALPVIDAFESSFWQILRGHVFRQNRRARRNVIQHPVNP